MTYLPQMLLGIGVLLMVIDVIVMGFTTFVLTIFAGALILSGTIMWAGFIPATLASALVSNILLTSALAALLWKPLKKLQNQTETTDVSNDFTNLTFNLEDDVDINGSSSYKYSGINWKLKSVNPILAGTTVCVVKTEVGVMWIEEKQ